MKNIYMRFTIPEYAKQIEFQIIYGDTIYSYKESWGLEDWCEHFYAPVINEWVKKFPDATFILDAYNNPIPKDKDVSSHLSDWFRNIYYYFKSTHPEINVTALNREPMINEAKYKHLSEISFE